MDVGFIGRATWCRHSAQLGQGRPSSEGVLEAIDQGLGCKDRSVLAKVTRRAVLEEGVA
jgi:hypothetical protein